MSIGEAITESLKMARDFADAIVPKFDYFVINKKRWTL